MTLASQAFVEVVSNNPKNLKQFEVKNNLERLLG